jgi:hypothetical protein
MIPPAKHVLPDIFLTLTRQVCLIVLDPITLGWFVCWLVGLLCLSFVGCHQY